MEWRRTGDTRHERRLPVEPIDPEDAILASRLLSEAKALSSTAAINSELATLAEGARKDLKTAVEVMETDHIPSLDEMYVEARKWRRVKNVVAVSADLKDSTSLSFDKYVNTSARLYEAATGSAVAIFTRFSPGFIQVQGDGMFVLFHGDRALERAFCSAVSLKTFSERHLVPMIHELFSDTFPETGYKLGMASGIVAVKKVGVRGTNEPVWAGKPVNWATKCAQKADRHELVVTSAVYDKLGTNNYVSHSCGCKNGGTPTPLWSDVAVDKLGKHAQCRLLQSAWCSTHGDEYCQAILDGQKDREDVPATITISV
jgi:class 3 adenylate cyclase